MASELFLQVLAPSKGERILDVGAGRGKVADEVQRASGGAEVHAVEPNEKRVASMKREFPAVRSSVASAEGLPFDDSYFDKVYTTMALHHFSDLDRSIREVARVLKPGGSLVVLEVEPSSGLGRMFRFFGRLLGEHMTVMTQTECVAKFDATRLFEVVRSTSLGSRYLVSLRRL